MLAAVPRICPKLAGADTFAITRIPKRDPPKQHVGPNKTSLERIPRVDETECVGCNLCSLVCPVDECITMVERPTGLAPQTWAEKAAAVECAPPSLTT